ncbi:hypothetical protein WJX81_004027 [Elliptochloris bilobata]|uniref:Uncharacterized protein n=1 Tax=Elliptochloris bilobata TaxID=381761 RepID=A0AAW1SHR9_9CHLO
MDAGVAPAWPDNAAGRQSWLPHRDLGHSWLAGLVIILFLVCTTSIKYVGDGARRAGLDALLNLAATTEGSSFLLSGHSINLVHSTCLWWTGTSAPRTMTAIGFG